MNNVDGYDGTSSSANSAQLLEDLLTGTDLEEAFDDYTEANDEWNAAGNPR